MKGTYRVISLEDIIIIRSNMSLIYIQMSKNLKHGTYRLFSANPYLGSQHVCPSKCCNKGVTEFPLTCSVTRIHVYTSILEHAYWQVLSLSTITIIPRVDVYS